MFLLKSGRVVYNVVYSKDMAAKIKNLLGIYDEFAKKIEVYF